MVSKEKGMFYNGTPSFRNLTPYFVSSFCFRTHIFNLPQHLIRLWTIDRTVFQFCGLGWMSFHLERYSGEQNFLGRPRWFGTMAAPHCGQKENAMSLIISVV